VHLDTWAPAQYIFGTAGGSGPVRSPGDDQPVSYGNATQQTFDTTLHWKLAGTIILSLVMVFVLQQLGFRFVIAAGVGAR
jgi:hypothetical protein